MRAQTSRVSNMILSFEHVLNLLLGLEFFPVLLQFVIAGTYQQAWAVSERRRSMAARESDHLELDPCIQSMHGDIKSLSAYSSFAPEGFCPSFQELRA